MTETIVAVLGTAGWAMGLLLLVMMAGLPLIERIGDRW